MQRKENVILKQMLDWIYASTEAHNQADVARQTGVYEATISRAMNGKIKRVKQETLRKINAGFGNIFNPEWLRGESDVMLVADLKPVTPDVPADSSEGDAPTTSSLINASLAAKDETIASIKRELDAKEATIDLLRTQLAEHKNLSKKYETLLADYSILLRRIGGNYDIHHVTDSSIAIAAESAPTSCDKKE